MTETLAIMNSMFRSLKDNIIDSFDDVQSYGLSLAIVSILLVIFSVYSIQNGSDFPIAGKRSKYEPDFWIRLRSFQGSWPIITQGYREVSNALRRSFDPLS